jgi:hypothetical protein
MVQSSTHLPSIPQITGDRTSTAWLAYFQYNRNHLLPIPWDCVEPLTEAERTAIARSIRTFQLGESSEGTHLMQLARNYAKQQGDRRWVEIVKLFIAEEQRHARDLGRFMQQQQLPLAQHHWTDTLFRKLRRLANLEVALMVLLTAELVATVYYPALGQATRSPVLQQLCTQIFHDELHHVQFQAECLRAIRQHRPKWQCILINTAYSLFFRAALLAVWLDHHPVLKLSGYTCWSFHKTACMALQKAYAIILR